MCGKREKTRTTVTLLSWTCSRACLLNHILIPILGHRTLSWNLLTHFWRFYEFELYGKLRNGRAKKLERNVTHHEAGTCGDTTINNLFFGIPFGKHFYSILSCGASWSSVWRTSAKDVIERIAVNRWWPVCQFCHTFRSRLCVVRGGIKSGSELAALIWPTWIMTTMNDCPQPAWRSTWLQEHRREFLSIA